LAVSHSSRERKTGKCYGICEVPRREIQIRKGRANTRFVLPFLCCNEEIDRNSRGGAFGPFRGCRPEKGGAARGLDRATPDLQLSEITRKGDFFVWIESLSGSGFLERFHTKNFSYTGRKPRLDVTIKRSKT
jgi:hypothetical protein